MPSAIFTGQCNGLDCHRHSRSVPGLDTCLGGESSHICSSEGRWIGHQCGWMMLRRLLL